MGGPPPSKASSNVDARAEIHHKSIGSVEGRLELASLPGEGRWFNVCHAVSGVAVKCELSKDMVDEFASNLGSRVLVSGLVSYNVAGDPISVAVERIRAFEEESSLPSIDYMIGLAPGITGELTTEEYIRELRGD